MKFIYNLIKTLAGKKVKIARLLLIVTGSVFITVAFISMLSPVVTLKRINREYCSDTSNYEKSILPLMNQDIFRLKMKEYFLRSKVMMAATDSIALAIDLEDSLVTLELRGIIIHQARIKKITYSKIFEKMNKDTRINYFSSPFIIETSYATIPKEPIIIKEAPKDTTEANSPAFLSDTIQKKSICMINYLDKYLDVEMRQYERPKGKGFKEYILQNKLRQTGHLFSDLFRYTVPEYRPWINIELSGKDIRVIYRSLPGKSMVSIKI